MGARITYAWIPTSGGRHGRRQQQPDRVASGSDQETREALKQIETARHNFGEIAGSKTIAQTPKTVAELKRKIRDSERIIAAYDRQPAVRSRPIFKRSPALPGASGMPTTPRTSDRPGDVPNSGCARSFA